MSPTSFSGVEVIHYLDYAAGCPLRPVIAERYLSCQQRYFVNPHAGTCFAEDCRRVILAAERELLDCLNISSGAAFVIWCSGGTEALNLAISGLAGKRKIARVAYDPTAHPAMLEPLRGLSQPAVELLSLPVDQRGLLQAPAEGAGALFSLFCCCHVNNETGQIQPLINLRQAIGGNCLFCLDAAQSFGRIPLPWDEAGIDLAVLSSRKIGGPASVGALICRRGIDLSPMLLGGGQQHGLRSGTLDTAAIRMFADTALLVCESRAKEALRLRQLREYLQQGIDRLGNGKWPLFSSEDSVPDIFSFAIPGYEGALVARLLAERKQIQIGSGSACSAESKQSSHVLEAMGIKKDVARCQLRVSIGHATTKQDIKAFLEALPEVLKEF